MAAPTGPNVGMEVAASQPRGSSQIPRRRARAHTDLIHVLEMSLSLHTFDAQDARWRRRSRHDGCPPIATAIRYAAKSCGVLTEPSDSSVISCRTTGTPDQEPCGSSP